MLHRIERETGAYGNAPRQTGQKFYEQLTDLAGSPRKASELLDSAGVPGVVFLDRQSRNVKLNTYPATDQTGKKGWAVNVPGKAAKFFETEAEARDFAQSHLTNNYVIFDPERIKVHAKNGELVGTAADEMPPAPPEPKYEPVTIAPSIDPRDVRDDTDIAPMRGDRERKRFPWPWQLGAKRDQEKVAGYEPGGMLSPHAQLSREVGDIAQTQKQEVGGEVTRMGYLTKALEKATRDAYGKKPTPAQFKEVQVALGNIDNRLTQAQFDQAMKIRDVKAREAFIQGEHTNNVAVFKAKQQAALASLPDAVRDAVIDMRDALDQQMRELLSNPGIDADLKARLTTDQGVFLHSNSYQHFENDVWGKYVGKSNDPEALRIRRAAETLFKNEIIAEKAHDYQVANPGTSSAAAIAAVSTSADIPQMVKTRFADYLRKDANEITRIHLLTGKMPVARNDSGSMMALRREGIPKEIRELWGQWDEPKANFVKTYSLLAKHNADIRMQNRIAAEGTAQGYIWTPRSGTPRPNDLVALGKPGDHGPLSDAYGPQLLKDGLSNYNHPAVKQLFTDLNRLALMTKTIGSIASGVHNFFGNIAFTIANGNLPWAVIHMPKGFLVTIAKGWEGLPKQGTRDEITELVRLGVLDSDITLNEVQSLYKAVEVGADLEKKMRSTAGGLYGAMEMLKGKLIRAVTPEEQVVKGFKNFYIGADNFWKYINYRTELDKQMWFNKGRATPLSLEEMKQNAARMVQDTLPNRERVSEWVKRSVGSQSTLGQFTGPFFTFPLESGRTVANNTYHAGREMFSPNSTGRERAFGMWRAAGMIGMVASPVLMSMLSRYLNNYTPADEAALRDSLPDYQKDASLLWMKPRDANGIPQYMDLSYLNPYGYYHSAMIAGARALHSGGSALGAAGKTALSAITPLITVQPGIGTIMDMSRNSDSLKGGQPIFNPEDTWDNKAINLAGRAVRGLAPGTTQNIYKTYLAEQGYKDPKSGRPVEMHRELESLVGAPHVDTLDTNRVMAGAVSTYKNRMGNAMRLLNDKVRAQGTVAPGEVTAAYEQANTQAFEIFTEMNKAYHNMLKLGMKSRAAMNAMETGFGTEILKGGLGKNQIDDIVRGVFYPIEISDNVEKDLGSTPHGRELLKEYRAVRKTKKKQILPR